MNRLAFAFLLVFASMAAAIGVKSVSLTGTGSSRTVIKGGGVYQVQNTGPAALPIWCEYGLVLRDGGTLSDGDGGQPLIATPGGTGEYFIFPGDPVLIELPMRIEPVTKLPTDNAIACSAHDGGAKNVVIKEVKP